MRTAPLLTAFWLSVSTAALAQPAATALTFEVASIKPNPLNCGGGPCRVSVRYLPGGSYVAEGVTLKLLVGSAYNVRDFQIEGGPASMASDRFDISARPEQATEDAPADLAKMSDAQRKTFNERMNERLRNLLADRFQLVLHRETKQQQVYSLEVAKGGPKLKESPQGDGRMRFGPGSLRGDGVQMGFLASNLSTQVSRPVIDKTGLAGKYDFELKWTPDTNQAGAAPFGPPPPGAQPPADPSGPTLFTALQEQLGLRLTSEKGPVEILVIDRAEKPSAN